jgi:hypothetical protein
MVGRSTLTTVRELFWSSRPRFQRSLSHWLLGVGVLLVIYDGEPADWKFHAVSTFCALLPIAPGIFLLLKTWGNPAASQGRVGWRFRAGTAVLVFGILTFGVVVPSGAGHTSFTSGPTISTGEALATGVVLLLFLAWGGFALMGGSLIFPPSAPGIQPTSGREASVTECPECHKSLGSGVLLADGSQIRCGSCKRYIVNDGGKVWSIPDQPKH